MEGRRGGGAGGRGRRTDGRGGGARAPPLARTSPQGVTRLPPPLPAAALSAPRFSTELLAASSEGLTSPDSPVGGDMDMDTGGDGPSTPASQEGDVPTLAAAPLHRAASKLGMPKSPLDWVMK